MANFNYLSEGVYILCISIILPAVSYGGICFTGDDLILAELLASGLGQEMLTVYCIVLMWLVCLHLCLLLCVSCLALMCLDLALLLKLRKRGCFAPSSNKKGEAAAVSF